MQNCNIENDINSSLTYKQTTAGTRVTRYRRCSTLVHTLWALHYLDGNQTLRCIQYRAM